MGVQFGGDLAKRGIVGVVTGWGVCGVGDASLAHATVDALPQQIRVAAVSGVLLDPVDQQLPDGDGVLPQTHAQVRMLGQHGVGGCLLTGQVGVCRVDHRLFGECSVEVGVARAIQLRWRVAR